MKVNSNMEHHWNDIERGRVKWRKPEPVLFVNHKFHIDWPWIEPGLGGWQTAAQLTYV